MTQVDPKTLARAVAPFESISPWPGLFKVLVYLLIITPLMYLTLQANTNAELLFFAALTAIPYSGLVIMSHDAIHGTCTGITFIDELFPRVVTWPLFWFHGVYSEVHKLHHKMNGQNLNDPERVQYTIKEYQDASPNKKLFIRHQWFFNVFVFAGLGLIFKTVRSGLAFFNSSSSMKRAFITDVIGILTTQILLFLILKSQFNTYRWPIIFLVFQYVAGIFLVLRAHIEHYGLWGKGNNFYDTQVWNCRNIHANSLVSWFFNHLNHHSIHHAFPRIPFYNLKSAEAAIAKVYQDNKIDYPFVHGGYVKNALKLATNPSLIDDSKAAQVTSGNNVVSIRV